MQNNICSIKSDHRIFRKSHLTSSCFILTKVSVSRQHLKSTGSGGGREGGEQISEELHEMVKE